MPPTESDYGGYDAFVNYAGVVPTGLVDFAPWPDCDINASGTSSTVFIWGCNIGPLMPQSTYLGLMSAATFTCDTNGTLTLTHGVGETTLVASGTSLPVQYHESPGTPETLDISCNAVATPTPTPNPVGGIALDESDGQPSRNVGLAVIALAMVLAVPLLATAGWRFRSLR
jgi:hypothetical protein